MLTHSFGRKAWHSLVVAGVAGMLGLVPSLQAQEPTPKLIPFEGQLVRDGAPITDTCALQFRVFDAPTGGKQIGAPIERPDVAVQGGYFMVTLDPSDAARLAPPHHLELAAKCGAETEFAVQGERLPLIAMDENAQALAAPAAARAGAASTEVAPQATTDTFWKLAGNAGTVLGQHNSAPPTTIVVMSWRWVPLLGTLWLIVLNAASMDMIRYHLARPENTHDFAFYVVVLGLALVGVVSGIAALRQGMRAEAALMPRWVPSFLIGIVMLCAGAIAVVLIPRPATASISPQVLAELPALTTRNFAFDQAELRVKVGETVALRLENTDVATHAFAVPKLGVDVPMRSGEASLALFRPTAIGKYTFVCSVPHHESMRGTLIVEP